MPEKQIRQTARQRLLRAVDDEDKVGKLRERRVAPARKGDDLLSVLPGVAHVVEDRLGLAALADGEHNCALVRVRALMCLLKDHVVVKMHVAEGHKAADRHALDDIGPDDVGKALAGRKDLPAPALVQQRAEAADEVRGIVVDQAQERLLRRLFGGGELAAEMVVELAVAIEAQPLAHLHDARRGQIVLRSDLLDAHALLAALDVRRDAGDHLPLILRQQIRQQKIIVAHKNSSSTAPTRSNSLHYKISRSYVKKSVRRTRPASTRSPASPH